MGRTLVGVALLGGVMMVGPAGAAPFTTVQAAFDGRQPEMPERLLRDGTPTTCQMEAFPGVFASSSFWQSFLFCNSGEETCFTATYEGGTCGDEVHLMAYLDRFDPSDLPTNYAGDVGGSKTHTFSFVVPAGARFVIVAQTSFGMADCAFGFSIDAMRCPAPAPLLSGAALALAAGVLLLIAFAALRRSRRALSALMLCALITVLAGPAAAPVGADPTPAVPRACGLSCSAEYKACAIERCDSGAMDKDPQCLTECRRSYDACVQACR